MRFFMGRTLDYVISRSPCTIVILKDCGNKEFKSVLVPVFDSGNDEYACEVADKLTEPDGTITLLRICGDKKNLPAQKYIDDLAGNSINRKIEIITTEEPDSVSGILSRIDSFDLLVVGIKEKRYFYNSKLISMQEKIAHLSNKPLILVKKSRGIGALTKRWF